ncbi:hypothetical protein E1267_01210 [Nonomuraea longispora]|uniref:Type II toxin-antitoxin system PemK/MazF family toxin n=1 Tax=Nonomuraea longispora TaxID=1848320 RepID=A0A4R4NTG5_9ACTN|nr:hypothetical protein E1267_01210 [Nonomuraea longispora]
MKLTQGDIWFTRFSSPTGREQGFDRPSLIVSNDKLNQSLAGHPWRRNGDRE